MYVASLSFIFYSYKLISCFFYAGLTTEGEGEPSTRFVDESLFELRRGSSSLDLSEVETREEMEHNPINTDGIIVPKYTTLEEIMVGVITLVEMKFGGNHSLLAKDQAKLTLLEVIVGATAYLFLERGSPPLRKLAL